MIKKWAKGTAILLGGLIVVPAVLAMLMNIADSMNTQFGSDVRDGTAVCPVESMTVLYKRGTEPKTNSIMVRCDGGLWGFAWLATRASDGWQQPQKLLNTVKPDGAFVCSRYRTTGWVGNFKYNHYRDCTPQP